MLEVYLGKTHINQVVRKTKIPSLEIITACETLPGDLKVFDFYKNIEKLIEPLKTTYDYIIIDSCPIIQAKDTLNVVCNADLSILVTSYRRTSRGMLTRLAPKILRNDGQQVYCVLNSYPPIFRS